MRTWRRKVRWGVEMNRTSARLLAQNPQILKRLAKYMAQQCFRNTVLEDFHAGITPYSEAGDYSDVVVKTPAGTIPWSKLSRLSDQEMKTLMIDVVNRTYLLLRTLFDEEVGSYLIQTLSQQDLMPNWNDPQ
jgi:ligand-binding SRPBCC domain-containing protein